MNKRSLLLVVLALFVAVSFGACSGKSTPKGVAKAFWKAMEDGNQKEIAKYITNSSSEYMTEEMKKKDDFGEVELGDAMIEGDKATVPTKLKNEDMKMDLKTILLKQDGKWKVDVPNTMLSMLGGAMGEMMQQMGQQMNEAVKGGMKGMEKALKGMEGSLKGLEKAMEDMDKDLEEKEEETEKSDDQSK